MEKLRISDYLMIDKKESSVTNANKRQKLMLKHRGIDVTAKGVPNFAIRTLAEYIISRIDIIRIDSNKKSRRLIKNNRTHVVDELSDITLKRICMEILDECDKKIYEEISKNELISIIDSLTDTYTSWEQENKQILFPNGIFFLTSFEFDKNFNSRAFFTYCMKYDYLPNADCPTWKKALCDMFPDDQEAVIQVIQEILGYTFLYYDSPADKLFYFFGNGRNGKSIIGHVIRRLHGEENIAGVSLSEISSRFSLSEVCDKRVCLCPENPNQSLIDTSKLKAITGRDVIKVEKKYQDAFSTRLLTKIIVSSNHYLRSDDTSEGFWKRILPIPFDVTFLPSDEYDRHKKSCYFKLQDTDLENKLDNELSGIFNWSIEGLKRLKKNDWGFTYSEKICALKNDMVLYSKPVSIFVKQCVKEEKGKKTKASSIHKKFHRWALRKNLDADAFQDPRKFHAEFKNALIEQGITCKVVKNSVDYYKYIVIRINS